jgi:ABC-2 type transport system ATP-binding protein
MELFLKDIRKSFDNKEVLKGSSFHFEKGKIYGLLGRNGAGKNIYLCLIYDDYRTKSNEGNVL